MRRLARTQGFTLIEISIVIAIMMILLSISAPSLRRFAASSKLKSSAKAIRSLLTYARDVAITENEGYFVVFDLDAQEYWLIAASEFDPEDPRAVLTEGVDTSLSTSTATSSATTESTSATASAAESSSSGASSTGVPGRTTMIAKIPQRPQRQVRIARLSVQHGDLMSEPTETGIEVIYFSPQGTAENAEIYLQDTRGKAIRIDVTQATGRVLVSRVTDGANFDLELPERSL